MKDPVEHHKHRILNRGAPTERVIYVDVDCYKAVAPNGAMQRFTKSGSFNTKDARRRIAAKLIEAEQYCF